MSNIPNITFSTSDHYNIHLLKQQEVQKKIARKKYPCTSKIPLVIAFVYSKMIIARIFNNISMYVYFTTSQVIRVRDSLGQVFSIPLYSSVQIGLVNETGGESGGKKGNTLHKTSKASDIIAMKVSRGSALDALQILSGFEEVGQYRRANAMGRTRATARDMGTGMGKKRGLPRMGSKVVC